MKATEEYFSVMLFIIGLKSYSMLKGDNSDETFGVTVTWKYLFLAFT